MNIKIVHWFFNVKACTFKVKRKNSHLLILPPIHECFLLLSTYFTKWKQEIKGDKYYCF